MNTFSRRSFLKTAGAATGAAAISASPAVAAAIQPGTIETAPSGSIPREPVIAIVRDPSRHEVTILSGVTEKTYKDPVLVKRLVKAADKQVLAHGAELAHEMEPVFKTGGVA